MLADRSLVEPSVKTIDTANLEHIAEQLLSSDELMRILARRLGLPEHQVVPARDMDSVFSVDDPAAAGRGSGAGPGPPEAGRLAPRDKFADSDDEDGVDPEDDLWSDDEFEVGDHPEAEVGELPGSQAAMATLRLKKMRTDREADLDGASLQSAPRDMPHLSLAAAGLTSKDSGTASASESAMGWRRLPRPELRDGFFNKCLETSTLGPNKASSDTYNAPVYLIPISPVDACEYKPEPISLSVVAIFIPNVKKDVERALATLERNIQREEELAQNIPTDDLLLFGEAKEMTSVDVFIARQLRKDKNETADPREAAVDKAIMAAKSGNLAEMEDALEEDISPDTADQFGNSLLLLAAQQGAKRMCKFILRRGANINFQNLVGNTALHYCFAYHNDELGKYLISRGANDGILNVDGLTCYEGLSHAMLEELEAVNSATLALVEAEKAAGGGGGAGPGAMRNFG